MNCEQVRELEAAFALDALGEVERHAVIAHLDGCREHPKLAEFRAVAITLAGVTSERRPPLALRERVMTATGDRGAKTGGGFSRWYAAAAIVVAACIAGSGWLVMSRDGGGDAPYVREFTSEGGVAVRVEADFEAALTQVAFRGLDVGGDYQLWAIRGEDWLSMGQFKANPEGGWSGEFSFAIHRGDSLCLTSLAPEQPSGPFGEPVFIEPL